METQFHGTVNLLVAISLLLVGCNDFKSTSHAEPSKRIADESKIGKAYATEGTALRNGHDDQENILGSWRATFVEKNGEKATDLIGSKIVFEKGFFHLIGIRNEYQLNPLTNPKQIDYCTLGLDSPYVGIYDLEGNKLRLCFPNSVRHPRPGEFKTVHNDGTLFIELERLSSELPESDNSELEISLSVAIDDAIGLLSRKEIIGYLEKYILPHELKTMKSLRWNETVEHASEQREALLNTFRVLRKLKPKMNHESTEAVFDLSEIHVPDGLPIPKLGFVKLDGKWYQK
jgi:uncharacterized protein (TIGR03067 family)